MLKIRDDVTYQKLNKLGFRKDDFNECYDYEVNSDVTISIDIHNKILTTFVWEGYEYRELASDEPTTIEQLEYCFPKMIDLVEEVKE